MIEQASDRGPKSRRGWSRAWPWVGSIVFVFAVGCWKFGRGWGDDWPARLVLVPGERSFPIGFTPDGRTFLTSWMGEIVPWDASTGIAGKPWTVPGSNIVHIVAYSPDGRTFATTIRQAGTQIYLFDVASGRSRALANVHDQDVQRMKFSGDGRTLRAVLDDSGEINDPNDDRREVATWDVSTGEETSRRVLKSCPSRGIISPDGRISIGWKNGFDDVDFWDLDADRSIGTIHLPSGSVTHHGLAFSPDSRTLALGRSDGAVDLCDVATLRLVKTIPIHANGRSPWDLRFAPGGRTLLSNGYYVSTSPSFLSKASKAVFGKELSNPGEVVFVDVATGKILARASPARWPFASSDGRTIATLEADHTVKLRDLPPSRLP